MTQPAPLTSTTFADGELTNETKWYSRVFTVINWLLGQFGDTGWITPTLGNSWVAFGSGNPAPQYRKLNGVVYGAGAMKSGTSGTTVFTLPAGSRPLNSRTFVVESNAAVAIITVSSIGAVVVAAYLSPGSNASVWLDGINFPAEQ